MSQQYYNQRLVDRVEAIKAYNNLRSYPQGEVVSCNAPKGCKSICYGCRAWVCNHPVQVKSQDKK